MKKSKSYDYLKNISNFVRSKIYKYIFMSVFTLSVIFVYLNFPILISQEKYLNTNIKVVANLNNLSIDQVNELLKQYINVYDLKNTNQYQLILLKIKLDYLKKTSKDQSLKNN